MPYKDPEGKKAWRRRNRESISAYTKQWKLDNPERHAAHQAASRINKMSPNKSIRGLPQDRTEYSRRYRSKVRMLGIERLGGQCERCGFDDPAALEFDHREALFRNTNGLKRADASVTAREILSLDNPHSVFALLCANCHRIKTRESGEWRHPSQYAARPADTSEEDQLSLL